MPKKILVLYPRFGDFTHLKKLSLQYEFIFDSFLLDSVVQQGNISETVISKDFQEKLLAKINQTDRYDGVIGTHDYPGTLVAGLYAERWGLSYPSVKSILSCQHKYYCRQKTATIVPEATPEFAAINQNECHTARSFPFFVKPIKSSFSRHAQVVTNQQDLQKLCTQPAFNPEYLALFNTLFEHYIDHPSDAHHLIAEDLLQGHQVSLEGYVHNNNVQVLGIVDASFYEDSLSFYCFSYPSVLPETVQKRMASLTKKIIHALTLDNTLFSIEYMYNEMEDRISLIEINPRVSAQFADFFEAVHGVNSYEILVALSLQEKVPPLQKGTFSHAASFPLRLFEDHKVTRVPSPKELALCKKLFPEAVIQIAVEKGRYLSSYQQDGNSYLYALINCAAQSKQELIEKCELIKQLLPFQFERRSD